MDNPQGKNVPDAHYERLRRHTGELAMLEWRKRLAQRPKTDLAWRPRRCFRKNAPAVTWR